MAKGAHDIGGNISLIGFSDIDGASMNVVKKVVGQFVQKLSGKDSGFEGLKVTLKELHKREKSEVYEVHAHLFDNGKKFNAISTDRNLFVALDDSLKRTAREAEHAMAKSKK
jgi:hypothetical protein